MNQMIFPGWNILVSGPFHPGNVNLLPNFYKDCSLLFVTCFQLQFSSMPPLVLFIISCWRRKSTNGFQAPCTPSTANPVLVCHHCFRPWADIDFCFVPLPKCLHKPTLWSVPNCYLFLPVPKSETPQLFYKFNVKDATKYVNFTV